MSQTNDSTKFVLYNANWDYELTVIIGGTLKSALRHAKGLKLRHLKASGPEAYGAVLVGNIIDHVMWFHDIPTPGLLAHESFHSIEYALSFLDIKHSEETSEVYSHTMEWTVREIWNQLFTNGMIGLILERPEKPHSTNTSKSRDSLSAKRK